MRCRIPVMVTVLASLVWCSAWLCAVPVAADADGDGVSDEIEETLGMAPDRPDTFVELCARPLPEGHADPARFVQRVELANAGGDRFVWRLTFAAPYPAARSIVQLYVDTDNNPQTGRNGHGCEVMLKAVSGGSGITAYTPDGVGTTPAQYPSVAYDGPLVYVSFDTALAQADGQSVFRLMVLSEALDPHRGIDSIRYFSASGSPLGEAPKVKRLSEVDSSVGVSQTFGPRIVGPLVRAPSTIRLPIDACELEGFTMHPSEYRTANATRSGGIGKIRVSCPATGRFHPGFVLHDERGREAVGIYLNGERLGIAVADEDDRDQHLFFLEDPVSVNRGDTLELRALLPGGVYRIEDLVLLRDRPEERKPAYEFRHLAAGENRLTWISTWPAIGTVEFTDGRTVTEESATCNHRITIPDLRPGQSQRFRVTATTPEGKTVDSGWTQTAWKPPVDVKTRGTGRIPLTLYAPGSTLPSPWPVTCGIPFPRGVLGSDRNLELLDPTGRTVFCQTRITSRWPDGSVRWVLLDFRHDGAAESYDVSYGPDVERDNPAAVDAPPPSLGTLELTDADGNRHTVAVAAPECVRPGALRSEWLASGVLPGDGPAMLAFQVRVHTYPGLPWVRTLVTYGNCFSGSEFQSVSSFVWRLPAFTRGAPAVVRQHLDDRFESDGGGGDRFAGALGPVWVRDFWQNYPKDVEVGADGAVIGLLPALAADTYDWAKGTQEEHRLFYWFDNGRYKMRQGMTKTQEVWIGLEGETPLLDRPLFAAPPPHWFRDTRVFGETPVATAGKPVVEAYDRSVAAAMDGYENNRRKNREYGQFNFGDWWGERLINWGNIEYDTQHGFFLHFARTGDFRFFLRGEEAELHNRDIDTVHYHRDPNRVGKVYAHCIGHVGDYYAKSPLDGPNRGTARGGFTVSHTWCEGHTDHMFLTGDQRSLDTARLIADAYGSSYVTNYDFTNCRLPGWHLILSMAVYRATGDPFYLNACRIIVDRVLERQTLTEEHGVVGGGWRRMMVPGHCLCTPRHYGNAGFMVGVLLTGLRHYHQETGDPAVAEAIRHGARYLVEDMWVPKVKGFRYTSCPESSSGPWSNLLLFDGISYAYRLSPDPVLARVMMEGTDSGIGAVSGFGKSFSQRIRVAPHCLDVLQELREDPPVPLARFTASTPAAFSGRMETAFDARGSCAPKGQAADYRWNLGDGARAQGASVTHTYRKGGRYTVTLTVRAGDLSDTTEATVHVPPRALVLAARDAGFVQEAEAFSAQGGGSVKVPSGRIGASAAIITGWHADEGHWLEWSVTPPQPGPYHLVLKAATDCGNARRKLLLNGETPSAACENIAFPRTGGYSTQSDNWEYVLVGDDTPAVLEMKGGENLLRMTNLGDGLALDQLIFLPAPQ